MNSNPFYRIEPDFEKLYVFGAGGSGREIAFLAKQSWGSKVDIEFVVDNPEYLRPNVNGYAVTLITDITPHKSVRFVIAIGNPAARRRIAPLCREVPLLETSIVHPRAELSDSVKLGDGTIICAGVIMTINICLGRHVHINLGCTVSHDAIIGDFATLSPGVHVSGNVRIGEGTFIGTGANIINGSADEPLIIGDNAIVAAGACVTKPVPSDVMVAGVPAVQKKLCANDAASIIL